MEYFINMQMSIVHLRMRTFPRNWLRIRLVVNENVLQEFSHLSFFYVAIIINVKLLKKLFEFRRVVTVL